MMKWLQIHALIASQFLFAQSILFQDVTLHVQTPKQSHIEINSPQINTCKTNNLCLKAPVIFFQDKNKTWKIEAYSGEINPQSGSFKADHISINPPGWWNATAQSIELSSEQQLLSLYNPTMKVKHFEITSPRATAFLRSENLIISGPWKMTMDKS
jgi:hypothetical protein